MPGLFARGARRVAFGLGLFWSWSASAQDISVSRGAGTEGCPNARELTRALPQLGRQHFGVEFTREGDLFVSTIHAATGIRRLEDSSTDCKQLARATLLVASLLDPDAPGSPAAPTHAEQASPTGSRTRDGAPGMVAIVVGAGLLARFGAGSAPIGALLAEWRPGALSLDAQFSIAPSQQASLAPGRVSFYELHLATRACYELLASTRWGLSPCFGPALGVLHGSGHGYDHDSSTTLVVPALSGALKADMKLGAAWAAGLELGAVAFFARPTLSVQGLGKTYDTAPLEVETFICIRRHFF